VNVVAFEHDARRGERVEVRRDDLGVVLGVEADIGPAVWRRRGREGRGGVRARAGRWRPSRDGAPDPQSSRSRKKRCGRVGAAAARARSASASASVE